MAVQLIRRFTVLAVAGVVVAGATGLVLAGWHVPGVDTIGTTLYGSVLSIKTLLVLFAVAVGGVNRFLLVRHLRASPGPSSDRERVWAGPASVLSSPSSLPRGTAPARTFVRSVRLELVVLLVVLLLSGTITAIPTVADVTAAGEDDRTHEFESETAAGELTVRVIPGHVGPNVFDVAIAQNGTAVDTDEPVTLILRNPERGVQLPEVELDRLDDGTYSTVEPIPSAGVWEVRVTTRASGSYVSERFETNVSDTAGGHEMSQEGGSREPENDRFKMILQYGAVGLLLVGGVGVGYEVRQHWRRTRE